MKQHPYMESPEVLRAPLYKVLAFMQHRIMNSSTYFGVHTLKSPTDFWMYQELFYKIRPKVIVEIGNFKGGGLLAWAHLLDNLKIDGKVIGVDINQEGIAPLVKVHPKITLLEGNAFTSKMVSKVNSLVKDLSPVIVIDDSAHDYKSTLSSLRGYSVFVTVGSYFIVEDGICWHGLNVGPKPGPYEAVETFLKEEQGKDFVLDRSQEAFLITWNPKGYLKRVK